MSYLSEFSIQTERTHPFPFTTAGVQFTKNIELSTPITFLIGDNGVGKSTLLETLDYRFQLPHIDGASYQKNSFEAAKALLPYLDLKWNLERSIGFFFRAEDFGDFINSVDRADTYVYDALRDLEGDVPEHILTEMRESANFQLHHMRENYGQELQAFSHGEAYLHIMHEKINKKGIFLLDEPEAALSPSKQLSLIYYILEHLKHNVSQFIIATHSPMLMALPGATIYEITTDGMQRVALQDTEHYSVTKSFLNNPEAYLRHL